MLSSEQPLWEEKQHLGQGSFGRVSLWERVDDDSQVMAVKFYDRNADHAILVRNLREEQLLQQITHPNIVAYYKQPPGFVNPQAHMGCGVICMEYCNNGDLRKMIKQSENVFGASQSLVLLFLSNVSSALRYLHKQNIIHRDIKPENILIKSEAPNSVAFKLVDLGFAMQFTNQSNFQSFVGTMQYFPPEMLEVGFRMPGTSVEESSTPNSSVDLWAFGVVTFELICGTRPFVPNMTGMEWLQWVKEKEKKDICIFTNKEENIIYSTQLLCPNQLDEPYAQAIAEFLTFMLDKDPMTRGGRDKGHNVMECDWPARLDSILSTRYVKVSLLHELRSKFYECSAGENMSRVIERISREIGDLSNMIILCNEGKLIQIEGSVDQCLSNKYTGEIYILPTTHIGKAPMLSLETSSSIVTLLEQDFSAIDGARFSFIVNPVFEFVYKRTQEVLTFLKAGVSLQHYLELHLEEMTDLEHNLRVSTETVYSRCSFIQDSMVQTTLKELESLLRSADPDQVPSIQNSIHLWSELKSMINSLLPEMHAIDTDHFKSAAGTITRSKELIAKHPCQGYIKELQMRFLHLQSVVRLLMEISDRTYYTNGTRLATDINDYIDFINSRYVEMQAFFLECIALNRSIRDHQYDFDRTMGLIQKDFLCNLNSKFLKAYNSSFDSILKKGLRLNVVDSPHVSLDIPWSEQDVSLSDTFTSLEDTYNQCENFFNQVRSFRQEIEQGNTLEAPDT